MFIIVFQSKVFKGGNDSNNPNFNT